LFVQTRPRAAGQSVVERQLPAAHAPFVQSMLAPHCASVVHGAQLWLTQTPVPHSDFVSWQLPATHAPPRQMCPLPYALEHWASVVHAAHALPAQTPAVSVEVVHEAPALAALQDCADPPAPARPEPPEPPAPEPPVAEPPARPPSDPPEPAAPPVPVAEPPVPVDPPA
jgi:hypothetical protein